MKKKVVEEELRGDMNLICLFQDLERMHGVDAKSYVSKLSERDQERLRLALESPNLPEAMQGAVRALQAALLAS